MNEYKIGLIGDCERFEPEWFVLIQNALNKLLVQNPLPTKEDEINKIFARYVRNQRKSFPFPIHYKLPIQPNQEVNPAEDNVPELTWLVNDIDDEPIRYDVECKRLLKPSSTWCKYYVNGGMQRYIEAEGGYSSNCTRGLMIGYLLELSHEEAFNGINKYAQKKAIPSLNLIRDWQTNGVSRLEHSLNRSSDFPPPVFDLRHFWVDLRGNYTLS